MKVTGVYANVLKQERERTWKYVEEYKARCTKFPLHPDSEMRMKNDWLTAKTVRDVLDNEKYCEKNIEIILNDHCILFRKYIIYPFGKRVTMIDIPTHTGTYKLAIKR